MRCGFLIFFELKSPLLLFLPLRYEFFILIKWFIPIDLSFHLIFPYFLIFLSSICYDVGLFVSFYIGDSNNSAASIKQISHIKSIFITMFCHT